MTQRSIKSFFKNAKPPAADDLSNISAAPAVIQNPEDHMYHADCQVVETAVPDAIITQYDIGIARDQARVDSQKIEFFQNIWFPDKDYIFPRR